MLLITIFAFITLLILISGLVIMAVGKKKTNKKYSNKLMIARITAQLLTIIIIALLLFFNR